MRFLDVFPHVPGAAVVAHVLLVAVAALDHLGPAVVGRLLIVFPGTAPHPFQCSAVAVVTGVVAAFIAVGGPVGWPTARLCSSLAGGHVTKRQHGIEGERKEIHGRLAAVAASHLGHYAKRQRCDPQAWRLRRGVSLTCRFVSVHVFTRPAGCVAGGSYSSGMVGAWPGLRKGIIPLFPSRSLGRDLDVPGLQCRLVRPE